jgi:transcriptional regulator
MATAKDDAREARRAEAIDLRIRGYTYREIAKELGVSVGAAFKDVSAALEQVRAEAAETAREHLDIELSRLDHAQVLVAREIRNGNLAAVDRLVKLNDQRAKLLKLYETRPRPESDYGGAGLVLDRLDESEDSDGAED